jgi:hypothetical protein
MGQGNTSTAPHTWAHKSRTRPSSEAPASRAGTHVSPARGSAGALVEGHGGGGEERHLIRATLELPHEPLLEVKIMYYLQIGCCNLFK